MKKLFIVLAFMISLIGFSQASFLSDIVNTITWRSSTNTAKKNMIYKSMTVSSDNTTGNIEVCLGCSGSNIIENLVSVDGYIYTTTGNTNLVEYTEWQGGYTPSNWGTFADADRWATNPTDLEIAEKLFWTNSAYVDLWSNNPCDPSTTTVTHVDGWTAFNDLWHLMTANNIYVLENGIHRMSAVTKFIRWSCIAIIWKWDANLFWDSSSPKMLALIWDTANNMIIGINLDWTYDYQWVEHSHNFTNIRLGYSAWKVVNSTIYDVSTSWATYWIYWFWNNATDSLNYINFVNSTFINNTWWIWIYANTIWAFSDSYVYNSIFEWNINWVKNVWSWDNWDVKYNTFSWNNTWFYTEQIDSIIYSNIFCNNTNDWYVWTNPLVCGDPFPWGWFTYTKYDEAIQFNNIVDANSNPYITWYVVPTIASAITWALKLSGANFYGYAGIASGRLKLNN